MNVITPPERSQEIFLPKLCRLFCNTLILRILYWFFGLLLRLGIVRTVGIRPNTTKDG